MTDGFIGAALKKRYGTDYELPPEIGNSTIELLIRHRTVRHFVPCELPDDELQLIVAAAQSASTSANFQFASIVQVEDPARRDRLADLAGNQQLVRDAAVFFVWVADWARSVSVAREHGLPTDGAEYLDSTISSIVDVALSAQNAAVAAESLGYGVTFVGALRNNVDAVCDELGLPAWTFPVFGLAIGLPDPNDPADIKPRFSQDVVLHKETYRSLDESGLQDYSERIGKYYSEQERPADWVLDRLAWRIGSSEGLHGRHRMRESFQRQGFPIR